MEPSLVLHLDIPESIAATIKLPEREVEPRIRLELAIALYAQDMLSFSKAVELANTSRYEFGQLLTRREIPRHYTAEDLELDLQYAGSL
jgi:predicted HTH domain antitoxin